MKRSEETDDYVTFLKNDATLEELKSQIVQLEQLVQPFQTRKENHGQLEGVYQQLWAQLGESAKEIDQIAERKKWIEQETIQATHKMLYEKKEAVKKIYEQSKATPKHENPELTKVFA